MESPRTPPPLRIRDTLWALSDTVPPQAGPDVVAYAALAVLTRLGLRCTLVPVGFVFFNEPGLRCTAQLSVFESGSLILPFGLNPPDHVAVRCGDWLFDAGLECPELSQAHLATSPLIARFDASFWSGDAAAMCSREGGGGAMVLVGDRLPVADVDADALDNLTHAWCSALQATYPELEALS